MAKKQRINIRAKGQTGEREIATTMNNIIVSVMRELKYDDVSIQRASESVQRNQNQSAVGGGDLSNTLGLSIEIKRQEQLSINTWWKQCTTAAQRNGEYPVLLFKQNRKGWRCITDGGIALPDPETGQITSFMGVRIEISWEDFQIWFRYWALRKLKLEAPRI